jgi:predicted ATPase
MLIIDGARPMLKSLRIQRFRMLDDLTVSSLGRVNLIVGKNNCGKSTVLDALRILARRGNVALLQEMLSEHNEDMNSGPRSEAVVEAGAESPYRNLFHGRAFPLEPDHRIYIGTTDRTNYVAIGHTHFVEETETISDGDEVFERRKRRAVPLSAVGEFQAVLQGLTIETDSSPPRIVPLSTLENRTRPLLIGAREAPVTHVPTQFLPDETLAELWDRIALRPESESVIQGLRIIEPDVEGLAFVKKAVGRYKDRTAVVKLRGNDRPVSLASMGDGMLRVLQLILSMFSASGGIFLVDEFENGLHHSVQTKIWDVIFELAIRLDIQTFATTHSWDCIEAFRDAAIKSRADGVLFRIGRSQRTSEKGRLVATVFSEEELQSVTQSAVEVR